MFDDEDFYLSIDDGDVPVVTEPSPNSISDGVTDCPQSISPDKLSSPHNFHGGLTNWLKEISDEMEHPLGTPISSFRDALPTFPLDSKAGPYHEYESRNPGRGFFHLLGKAFGVPESEITNEEAIYHATLARLLLKLTETDRLDFAYLLREAVLSHTDQSIFRSTTDPTSRKDFQEVYLNAGKTSTGIIRNIPRPVP